MIKYVLNIYC